MPLLLWPLKDGVMVWASMFVLANGEAQAMYYSYVGLIKILARRRWRDGVTFLRPVA